MVQRAYKGKTGRGREEKWEGGMTKADTKKREGLVEGWDSHGGGSKAVGGCSSSDKVDESDGVLGPKQGRREAEEWHLPWGGVKRGTREGFKEGR